MAAIPSDFTVVGTVLAVAVAILILSGLALYVAFRVRETFRDQKGKGAKVVTVAFLVGILFLSGGVFYFFASALNPGTTQSASTTSSSVSSSSNSATSATSSSTTSVRSTSPASTASSTTQGVSMPTPQCPSQVTAGEIFHCTIYIYNLGSTTYSTATLTASGTLYQFTFISCLESVNGGTPLPVSTTAHTISVGDIVPGTTVLTLTMQAPTQAGQNNNNVLTLTAPGLPQEISQTFSIQVTH